MSTILHLQRYISNSSDTRLLIFSGLAAAGVGALGSLFGGLFGKKGSDKTNQMNLQIARETNQANRENQEYQNAWNLEQWNRENEYNSPLEKRKRLEAAGLNPIFYGLDGAGNAGSLQSAPFTAVNGAPMLNSGEFMANGIANAAKTAAEIQLMQSQAKKNDAERDNTELENQIVSATMGDVIRGKSYEVEILKGSVSLPEKQGKVLDAQYNKLVQESDSLDKTTKLALARFGFDKLQFAVNSYLEKLKIDQNEKKILQDGLLGYIRAIQEDKKISILANVSGAQIRLLNSQASNVDEDTRRKKYDNDFREETQPIYDSNGHPTVFTQRYSDIFRLKSKSDYNDAVNRWEFRDEFLFSALNVAEREGLINKGIEEDNRSKEFSNDFAFASFLLGSVGDFGSLVSSLGKIK